MPHVLLIDNDDSFTYNIVDLLRTMPDCQWAVENWRNVRWRRGMFSHLLFSPGPGVVKEYGPLFRLLDELPAGVPVLGICLGHQVLAWHAGGRLKRLRPPVHGQAHRIRPVQPSPLFEGLPDEFEAGLYHSWAVDEATLPPHVQVIAYSHTGEVMGIHMTGSRWYGVQFHPESHLTPYGRRLLYNFLRLPSDGSQ